LAMRIIIANNERRISAKDIDYIRRLIRQNPTWNRTGLSRKLCQSWQWYSPNGRPRDMTCRTLLLKLERQGQIVLPPPLRSPNNHLRNRRIPNILHSSDPIHDELDQLIPLQIINVCEHPFYRDLFKCLLNRYHYIGYQGSPGETLWYLIVDRYQRPLACLLFAAAAWKIAPRDQFIGWDATIRRQHLIFVTNNTRFLILPWVDVNCLASHILSKVAKQIQCDWIRRYNHPIYLLETFVDQRFQGTSYKAANWIKVGQTSGRTRQDRNHRIQAPVKDIYLYPLSKTFRQDLSP